MAVGQIQIDLKNHMTLLLPLMEGKLFHYIRKFHHLSSSQYNNFLLYLYYLLYNYNSKMGRKYDYNQSCDQFHELRQIRSKRYYNCNMYYYPNLLPLLVEVVCQVLLVSGKLGVLHILMWYTMNIQLWICRNVQCSSHISQNDTGIIVCW